MATVRVFDRSSNSKGDASRVPIIISDVKLGSTVQDFRKRLNEEAAIPADSVDVIYCGQYLREGQTLESYGMHNESTVYLLPKLASPSSSTAIGGKPAPEALTAIRVATHCPSYRQIVERMLSNPEAVENLISTTPGLDEDPAALSLIQDPALVAVLIQPQNRDKLFQQHPAFAELAVTVAAVVNEEAAKEGNKPSTGTYSLDQMSDEDEESEMMAAARPFQGSGAGGNQPITASQLAAALAAATGATPSSPQVASTDPQQPSTSNSSFISQDFFQQAMMQAQSGGQPGAQPSHPNVTQSQLQQLHEMGITDENRARRALEICNGDIHAALELMFSDSSF